MAPITIKFKVVGHGHIDWRIYLVLTPDEVLERRIRQIWPHLWPASNPVVAESPSAAEAANCKGTSYAYCCEFCVLSDCSQGTTTETSHAFRCGVGTPSACNKPPVNISTVCVAESRRRPNGVQSTGSLLDPRSDPLHFQAPRDLSGTPLTALSEYSSPSLMSCKNV